MCQTCLETPKTGFLMLQLIYICYILQCQCLINVCGDAVCTSKDGDVTALIVPESARKHSDSPSASSVSSVFKETPQPQNVQGSAVA